MDSQTITQVVDEELAKETGFDNWHGIDRANIRHFLTTPTLIYVVDAKNSARIPMWIVLQTGEEGEGYSVAYHAGTCLWVLVHREPKGEYQLILRSSRLAKVLTRM